MSLVDANGIRLEVEVSAPSVSGAAVPVLLVMGLGMQLVAWPPELVVGLLAQGRTVIRFDNRDAGLSTKRAEWGRPNLWIAAIKHALRLPLRTAYTLDDMAADTVGLLDALGVQRCHLVGVSMGGMIGQIVAARHPARVVSFTCIMSSSGARHLPGPTPPARRVLLARPPDPRDRDAQIEHFVRVLSVIGSPGFPTPAARLREHVALGVNRAVHPIGIARQLVALAAAGDRSALLSRIVAPTAIVHGRADPLVPVAAAEDLARKIPGATLTVVDGMGHDLPPGLIPLLLETMRANFARGERAAPPG